MPPEDFSYYARAQQLTGRQPEQPPVRPGEPRGDQVPAQNPDLVTQNSLLRTREVARPNDYTGKSGAYDNPYAHLQKAHQNVKQYGIQFAAQDYYSAIGASDRIDQRKVQQDRINNEKALAEADLKLKDPQKFSLNAQQVKDLQEQKQFLLQRKEALNEIWLSPATTRANFALACIRSGVDQYVRLGENLIKSSVAIRPEIRQDENFLRHYQDAYMELARKRGTTPVVPPLPEVKPNPNPNPEVKPNPNPNPNPNPEGSLAERAAFERAKLEREIPELKKAQDDFHKKMAESEEKLRDPSKLTADERKQVGQELDERNRELEELKRKVEDAQRRFLEVQKVQGEAATTALKQQVDELVKNQGFFETRLTEAKDKLSKADQKTELTPEQTQAIAQMLQTMSSNPWGTIATLGSLGVLGYYLKRFFTKPGDTAAPAAIVEPRPETKKLVDEGKVEVKEEHKGKEGKIVFKEKGDGGKEVEFKDGKFRTAEGKEVAAADVEAKFEIPPGTEAEQKASTNRLRNKATMILEGKGEYTQFLPATKIEADTGLKGDASKLVYRTKDGAELDVVGVKDGKLVLRKPGTEIFAVQDKVGEGESIVLKVSQEKVADATVSDRAGGELTKLAMSNKSNLPSDNPPAGPERPPAEKAAEARAKLEKDAPDLQKAQDELRKKLEEAEKKLKEAEKLSADNRKVLEQNLADLKREQAELNRKVEEAQRSLAEVEKVQGSEATAAIKQQLEALAKTQGEHNTRLTNAEAQLAKLPAVAVPAAPVAREVIPGSGIKIGMKATVGDSSWTVIGGEGEHVVVSTGNPITEGTEVKPYDKDKMTEVKIDGREGKFFRHIDTGEVYKLVQNNGADGVVVLNGVEAHGKRSPVLGHLRDAATRPAEGSATPGLPAPEGVAFSEAERVKFEGEIARDFKVENGVATFRGQSRNLVAEAAQSIKDKQQLLEKIDKRIKGETVDIDLPSEKTELAQLRKVVAEGLSELETAHKAATPQDGKPPDYSGLDKIARRELPERLLEAEVAKRGGSEVRPPEVRPGVGRYRALLYLLPAALAVVLIRPGGAQGATVPPVYAPTIPSGK
jgi:hypothetical protein